MIEYRNFEKVEMRVGKIVNVQDFPEARKPAFKLKIDFGEKIGIKKSSAGVTENYTKEELIGRFVICTTNLVPRQIANFMSEVLTMGIDDKNGHCILLRPDSGSFKLGSRVY